MAKKEYSWRSGETPPPIEPHSFAKHRVYEEYISHYIQVRYADPRIPAASITLVDGFAGGGVYYNSQDNTLYEGSPLRLIRAASAAEKAINIKRESQGIRSMFQLHTTAFFVEKERKAFDYLKRHLADAGLENRFGHDVHLLHGDFREKIEVIVENIRKRQRAGRAIFFLDQYGWSKVPFPLIQRIFATLPNAEVILTFATDWLIGYLANDERFKKAYHGTGLQDHLPLEHLLLEKTDNREWRAAIQAHLHRSIPVVSGARYYTPFFIKSTEANRTFWLLHLSNHPKARDVMAALHWRIKNQFSHSLGPGIRMFGYDPQKDQGITGMDDMFGETEYGFDDIAESLTLEAVRKELPKDIHQYPDGITYGIFYQQVANHTPATSDHLKAAIESLINVKEIEVFSPDGAERRKASTIRDEDILRVPRQGCFYLPGFN